MDDPDTTGPAGTPEGDGAAIPRDPSEPAARPLFRPEPPSARPLGLFARFGLAIAHPRWALTVAADRDHAGRSGSDLIAAIGLLLVGTQLRGLATAAWLGSAVDP